MHPFPRILDKIVTKVASDAGLTLDIVTGKIATKGFIVATEGFSLIVPHTEFFSEHGQKIVSTYIEKHKVVLTSHGRQLGVWHDKEDDVVVLDVVDKVYSRDEVLRLGTERHQKAVYDLAAGALIPSNDA